MFLGIEFASLAGAVIGLVFLVLFLAFLHEQKERRYEQQAHHLWRDDAYKLVDDIIAESIRREEAEDAVDFLNEWPTIKVRATLRVAVGAQ